MRAFLDAEKLRHQRISLEVDLSFAEGKLRSAADPNRRHPVLPNYLKRCERDVRKATAALAAFILTNK